MEDNRTSREYVVKIVSEAVKEIGGELKEWPEAHGGLGAHLTSYQGNTYLTIFKEYGNLYQIEFSYNVRIPVVHRSQIRVIRQYVDNYNQELAKRDAWGAEVVIYVHKKCVWLDMEICTWTLVDNTYSLHDVFHVLGALDDIKAELIRKIRIIENRIYK